MAVTPILNKTKSGNYYYFIIIKYKIALKNNFKSKASFIENIFSYIKRSEFSTHVKITVHDLNLIETLPINCVICVVLL